MKTVRNILAYAAFLFAASATVAQGELKTEAINVWGNCNVCKSRIEKAAVAAGAQSAKWDKKTKVLTVSLDPKRVTAADIEKKVAGVGHDTQHVTATADAYGKLPECCQYDRK